MNYFIVIPSYNRIDQIQEKTLKLLKNHKIDMDKVYVFTDPSEYKLYKKELKKWKVNVIKSKDSILETRNHIIKYFDNNIKIVEMDDDVEDIQTTKKGKANQSIKNLKKFFNESFELIGPQGLWGMNSNTNNYFATGDDKKGLYSIVNSCLGYINNKKIKLTVQEKEDFERCLQFYKLKLPIIKRCGYGIKTKYWTNKGGIQSKYNFEKRVEVQKESAEALMSKYPGCCFKRIRKNGIVDIRFKRDPLKVYL